MSVPKMVQCTICSDICKRAVNVPCCKVIACRACAVSSLTKDRKCWKCAKPLTNDRLVNDEKLRSDIDKLGDISLLLCSLCGEVMKRGVGLSCCSVTACRACAVKKITSTRSCWSATCSRQNIGTDSVVNNDMLRDAVEHFKEFGIQTDKQT